MSSEGLHEAEERLSEQTKNMHRAIVSLMEELEAVDWYQQRAEGATDDALRAVIEHNRDEEIEHASMTLEWIRRNNPRFDENLRTYLFTSDPITEIEEVEMAAEAQGEGGASEGAPRAANKGGETTNRPKAASSRAADGSLAIGSLKETP
ncbi:encapsulin-associated ferritin-like protein [Pendulispora albinea]|uniref:Ferritin-like domain-containing protein n=1 Tax=Pendulispora albinea TaxID=2741071 RepID=A0ABZ2LQR6_9BACT